MWYTFQDDRLFDDYVSHSTIVNVLGYAQLVTSDEFVQYVQRPRHIQIQKRDTRKERGTPKI